MLYTRWGSFDNSRRSTVNAIVNRLKAHGVRTISETSGAKCAAKRLLVCRWASLRQAETSQTFQPLTKKRQAPSETEDNGAAASKRPRTESDREMSYEAEFAASSLEETGTASGISVSNLDSDSQNMQAHTMASPDSQTDHPVDRICHPHRRLSSVTDESSECSATDLRNTCTDANTALDSSDLRVFAEEAVSGALDGHTILDEFTFELFRNAPLGDAPNRHVAWDSSDIDALAAEFASAPDGQVDCDNFRLNVFNNVTSSEALGGHVAWNSSDFENPAAPGGALEGQVAWGVS